MSIVRNIKYSNLLIKLLYVIIVGFSSLGSFAHKVNVFAEVHSGVVNISCYYSKGEEVHAGEIKVLESKNGKMFYSGTTDENGLLSFKIPETVIKDNSDIKIILNAGMGHRAEWDVSFKDIFESRKILGENSSLISEKERKRNEVEKEKAVELSEISFPRVVLGLIMLLTVSALAYFLTRKRKGGEY